MVPKLKEWKFRKLLKIVEGNTFSEWIVLFDGKVIGKVQKTPSMRYKAIALNGRYIGSGANKHEAKLFVGIDFYGDSNIIWKG